MKKGKSVSISIPKITSILPRFFKRYHVVIYTLTVVIGVSIATFMLNGLLSRPEVSPTASVPTPTVPVFDQEIIDRINNFNTSSTQEDTFSLPAGRINPLVD